MLTLRAPWSKTQNDGFLPSSGALMSSSSTASSTLTSVEASPPEKALRWVEWMGSTKCRDTAGGLATSSRSTKPHNVSSLEILQWVTWPRSFTWRRSWRWQHQGKIRVTNLQNNQLGKVEINCKMWPLSNLVKSKQSFFLPSILLCTYQNE